MSDSRPEQCWIVSGTKIDPPPEHVDVEDVRRLHHEYISQLDADGLLVVHGAMRDEHGTRRGPGMIVVRAKTRAEAEQIARREPYVAHGVRRLDLTPWQIQFGHVLEKHDI
jgi:uncharacterized protein YciI